jgi:tetratricopeptide (TPR) repeat protein
MISVILAAVSVCPGQELTAEQLIEAGHWKRARALVEARLRESPDDPNATFLLSQIRNAFGDRSSPLGLAEKAVRLDGRTARYHRQLAEVQGVMAQHAGMFQQVMLARRFRKEIDTALEFDPRDTQALRDLLEFYLLAPGIAGGDAKKADMTAERIGGIDPCEGFLARARIAEFRKDDKQTERMLRRATEVRPPSYKALIALAEFYLAPAHRDDSMAEAVAKNAMAIDGGRVQAYCVLAVIDARRGDWAALDAILSQASERVPDDRAAYYRAAESLLMDNRDLARAERYLRMYLAQEPEGNQLTAADAHWKLGLALRSQGQGAAAIREWKAAIELDPNSPAARELKQARSTSSTHSKSGGPN